MNKNEEAETFNLRDQISPKEAYVPKKNKSCFFVLPLLGYPSYWYYGLINCYLRDNINKPELGYKIFLNLSNYDKKVLNIHEFNQFYQLEDKTYMYVFDIPKRFEDDYYKFCEGKYSKISPEAKTLICKLSGIKPVTESVVHKVLYKTSDMKQRIEELIGEILPMEAEVYSVPNLDKETYSIFKIRNSNIVKAVEDEVSERG